MAVPLTSAQERTLRSLCARYHQPFDPDAFRPAFDLPTGWVCGVIGGVTFGVDPDGSAAS